MPPIQIAAPNWCRNSTSSSGVRLSSRAAAWVVSVAAANSITQARSADDGARCPSANRVSAISAAARSSPCRLRRNWPERVGDRKVDCADQHQRLQRDGVPSQNTSASALQPAMEMQVRSMLCPGGPDAPAAGAPEQQGTTRRRERSTAR